MNRPRRAGGLLLLALLSACASRAAPGPGVVRLRVLTLNDLHGQLEPGRRIDGRPVGSAGPLAAWLMAERSGTTLLVHAGDLVGATPPASGLLQDEPAVAFLNLLHGRIPVVGTLGNHEFDEGPAELRRLLRGGNHPDGPFLEDPWPGARYPTVCANVPGLLDPFVVREVEGVEVAFVGAVTANTPRIVGPGGTGGLTFEDEADAVNRAVPAIRAAGAEAIVLLLHEGGERARQIVARLDDAVDLVVAGHTHQREARRLPNAAGRPVPVVQAEPFGAAFGRVDLALDRRSGDVLSAETAVITAWADEGPGLRPDADAGALEAAARARVAPLTERVVAEAAADVTRVPTPSGESALGNLVADAQRAALSADLAFINPGGLRADLWAGPVTWGELFQVQPFGKRVDRLVLRGEQVLELLAQQWDAPTVDRVLSVSGLTYAWDPATHAVHDVRVGGRPLDPSARYSVAVGEYLADGGDGLEVLRGAEERTEGPLDVEALVAYLRSLPRPFTPPGGGRIVRR